MKELTRTTTVELTEIIRTEKEGQWLDKEEYEESLKSEDLSMFDDVNILKIQDFVRDTENE